MTWPTIPPEHEGRSFRGSRFPGYEDPAFGDFQRHHVEQMMEDLEWAMLLRPDAHCLTHRRALTPRELEAGACFWCRPERYPGKAGASKPSEVDDENDAEALF